MKAIQEMLNNWSLDRPTIAKNNTLERLQALLEGEMQEFKESPDPTEAADLIIFTLSIANLMGWDMDKEVREKISLNLLRYPSSSFQEGDYEDSRLECKKNEKPILEEFYSI